MTDLVTIPQAAAMAGIHESTMRRRLEGDLYAPFPVGQMGTATLYRRSDIAEYIDARPAMRDRDNTRKLVGVLDAGPLAELNRLVRGNTPGHWWA